MTENWGGKAPGISENDRRRAYSMGLALAVVSASVHFSFCFVFYLFDRPTLLIYNIASTGFFVALAVIMVRYRPVALVWSLCLLEFGVATVVVTTVLGVQSGFPITPMIAAGVAAPIRFASLRTRIAVLSLSVALTVAGSVYSMIVGPTDPFPADMNRWLLLSTGLWAAPATAIIIWFFMREMWRAEAALEAEYQRSERLLHNIMPTEVAERLKAGEGIIADSHPHVTVLFADIVGFTERSSRMAPDKLVALLNQVFSRFDELIAERGIEKIKTIGDAYLAVAGMPRERADHAEAIAQLALDMQAACADLSANHVTSDGEPVQLRIGIHSGPVVAGIIGTAKFAYDLWGDVVNTASRMESNSEPGRIQISDATHDLLASTFAMTERGIVDIKGKGPMRTWFLEGRAEAAQRPVTPPLPA